MRYLSLSELIYINGRLLNNAKIMSGKQKVRDIDLLDAAASRPESSAFGADAYPTLEEKAAVLLHAIARNHPFTDGNKRTATVAALMMLEVNGQRATWNAEEALTRIVEVAEGKADFNSFAAWLPLSPCPESPEPDAAQDAAHIDRLIAEHRWLLDELDKR